MPATLIYIEPHERHPDSHPDAEYSNPVLGMYRTDKYKESWQNILQVLQYCVLKNVLGIVCRFPNSQYMADIYYEMRCKKVIYDIFDEKGKCIYRIVWFHSFFKDVEDRVPSSGWCCSSKTPLEHLKIVYNRECREPPVRNRYRWYGGWKRSYDEWIEKKTNIERMIQEKEHISLR